jgi:alcohol dehydrogenase class IV
LLVAGGGTLIDKAKMLRTLHPSTKLAVLPTIWGSGAEATPFAVVSVNGKKVVHGGPELLPDLIVRHIAFAESLPGDLARFACGDAWAHALEGFLSPLGNDETRSDLVIVLKRMLQQPIGYAADWLELSALSAAGQAKTSVGLVHGIAHTLEAELHRGHAEICSIFLLPVMSFNKTRAKKWPLLSDAGLTDQLIFHVLRQLFDKRAYEAALASLKANWLSVLRNECTRTNSALVRPNDIEFFENFQP